MNNNSNLLLPKIKDQVRVIIPYLALTVILGLIAYLAWLNHHDFEKVMARQVQTQMLMTVLSEAQSFKKQADVPISVAEINSSFKHINDIEKAYMFMVDGNGKIICYPYASNVGKDILELAKGRISNSDWVKFKAVMQRIKNGDQGTEIVDFFSDDAESRIVKTFIAFAPIKLSRNKDAIVLAMEYDVIAGPIHKNSRENIIFMAVIGLILSLFGGIFYKIHQEKDRLAISEAVSRIINKQLHLEIDERKKKDATIVKRSK
jgi:hypothetical protein